MTPYEHRLMDGQVEYLSWLEKQKPAALPLGGQIATPKVKTGSKRWTNRNNYLGDYEPVYKGTKEQY